LTRSLRFVGDTIEMDGRVVATLVPGLRLSDRDKLEATFDAVEEDAETIVLLEIRIAQLEAKLKAAAR
jgi:hypothetical protein